MPRPPYQRKVDGLPRFSCFKPAGVPLGQIQEVVLTVDEYYALRLADLEGLYQEQVAEKMGISRQTAGRILESARKKVADALANGKALRIAGGAYVTDGMRSFSCLACNFAWNLPFGGGRPPACPVCGSPALRRTDTMRGMGRGFRHRHGWAGGRRGFGGPSG